LREDARHPLHCSFFLLRERRPGAFLIEGSDGFSSSTQTKHSQPSRGPQGAYHDPILSLGSPVVPPLPSRRRGGTVLAPYQSEARPSGASHRPARHPQPRGVMTPPRRPAPLTGLVSPRPPRIPLKDSPPPEAPPARAGRTAGPPASASSSTGST